MIVRCKGDFVEVVNVRVGWVCGVGVINTEFLLQRWKSLKVSKGRLYIVFLFYVVKEVWVCVFEKLFIFFLIIVGVLVELEQ